MKKSVLPEGSIIIGRNSIKEVLRSEPERVLKLYTSDKQGLSQVLPAKEFEIAKKARIPFETISRDELTNLAKSDSHQSILAVVSKKQEIGIKDFLKNNDREHSLVLMLDDVQDPHNFGAILRAAECYGADLVIYSKNKGASLTPSVTKASVGASELISIAAVSNLVDAIGKFKEAGYWAVLADADPEAANLRTFEFPKRTLLIMGSEGRGAQALIKKEADFKVFIELFGKISSLNVSQAAAVMLDAYRRSLSV